MGTETDVAFFSQKVANLIEWIEKNTITISNEDDENENVPILESDVTHRISLTDHCSKVVSWELRSLNTFKDLYLNGNHPRADEIYSELETHCSSFLSKCEQKKALLQKTNINDSTSVPCANSTEAVASQPTTRTRDQPSDFLNRNFWRLYSITHQIFGKLNLKDLKSCRLVSKEWRLQSKRSFLQAAECCIETVINSGHGWGIKRFNEDFPSPDLMPFSAVSICGYPSHVAAVDDLQTLFNKWKCFKEVHFANNVNVTDDKGFFMRKYELSFAQNKITALRISADEGQRPSELAIRLSHFVSLRKLYLSYCTIIMDGRIAPTELKIVKKVMWMEDGNEITGTWEERRRRFLDVYRLKKLVIIPRDIDHNSNPDDNDFGDLDADKYFTLQIISFGGQVFTWKDLQIKKLHLSKQSVDFSLLPSSIELLFVDSCRILPCTKAINLPNLKIFVGSKSVEETANTELLSEIISMCPRLSYVDITWPKLDLNKLPTSVSILTMWSVCEIVGSEEPFALHKLVMKCSGNSNLKRLNDNLKKFKVLNTTILDSWGISRVDVLKEIFSIVEYTLEIGATVAVGKFDWNHIPLKTEIFPFLRLVRILDCDSLSEHYIFKDGAVKTISPADFMNLKESISPAF